LKLKMMLYLIIILLTYSINIQSYHYHNTKLYHKFRNYNIFKSTTTNDKNHNNFPKADEPIVPSVYREDLYAVLSVPRNATKDDLRIAYWSIAARNHPDRNQSIEALELFRNASYAYQILGRDNKTRKEYDSKYQTKVYLDAIEDVGNGLIIPLAMEVAIPLINMSVQAIGSIAVPLIKDTFEQSNAIFKGVFNNNNDETQLNIFDRAKIALDRKVYEQQMKKQIVILNDYKKSLNEFSLQYNNYISQSNKYKQNMIDLSNQENNEVNKLSDIHKEEQTIQSKLNELADVDMQLTNYQQKKLNYLNNFELSLNNKTAYISNKRQEIKKLELLLQLAKEDLSVALYESNTLNTLIDNEKQDLTNILIDITNNNNQIKSYEKQLNNIKSTTRQIESFLSTSKQQKQNLTNQIEVLNDLIDPLKNKINQLNSKKENIEKLIGEIKQNQLIKESEYEMKRKNLIELEKLKVNQLGSGFK